MTRTASQPPQKPQPQPPRPPGPHDPPGGPITPPPIRVDARPPASLKESSMYPGMETFHPEETCHHGQVGTPVRAINSRRVREQ